MNGRILFARTLALFAIFAVSLATSHPPTQAQSPERRSPKRLKVFLLAGQSNMQGQGVVDLDHPEHYNGGRGTLNQMLSDEKHKDLLKHAVDSDGNWRTRSDVGVRYRTETTIKAGGLSIGFTGYDGQHHIGPEFQMGHVLGEHFDSPVLLVKTAWGGKSLHKDFRPPSAEGDTGPYYHQMIREYREAISKIPSEFPQWKDLSIELCGVVWFQGWNDMVDQQATAEYEQNLTHLIKDLRADLGQNNLPFVVGELGNGGQKAGNEMKQFRRAQRRGTSLDSFVGNVAFVKTSSFARPKEQSPNPGHGHHWFGNAESYFLIGDAFGKNMIRMVNARHQPQVLILGDSISIGYTPTVRNRLADLAFVHRPINRNGGAENCEGTTKGVGSVDRWVNAGRGRWDVIHFNFGLHDLKHVDATTRKISNKPTDPPQATLEAYENQLRKIVARLQQSRAKLIFATTTPVPAGGVRPFRDPESVARYNEVAKAVMKEHGIEVNDLYEFANQRLETIQLPVNVHFSAQGSAELGEQVAEKIRELLSANSIDETP